uniref:Uncharacterized protein n=1 Tax=uncultured Alphaproteobacteria bacterium TaxID=91750 RepID=A0A6G8F394_9PROT|nr:hypothetical protein PlAlph_6290 [uncultured Alphaproteobacteria bacterium]
MNKLFTLLVTAGCFVAFQANAANLVETAQTVQNSIDNTAANIENAKGSATEKWNNKKAEMKAAAEQKKAEAAAKKAEAEAAKKEKAAAAEAKKAEQKKAIEDTKNSLSNLKNSLTR